MIERNDLAKFLPSMKSGKDLIAALSVFPAYDDSIRFQNNAVRLMALTDLYTIYIPSQMSMEIYSKLYLALLRSIQKKQTTISVRQQYENRKAIKGQEYTGIIGGSDSFTIIGTSGIGKSSAISRAISLITEHRIIETQNPYTKIIPSVTVQCPFDSSVKGLLLEILRKVDELLDSKYYSNALRARATTDMLIGSVSQVAMNHIGLLIVDEIQNVVNSKNGKSLIGSLTQLINNSGISICMVGTPECEQFFESAMQLARRSVGLTYSAISYDDYFKAFCKVLFGYQYVREKTVITDVITEWLYEHSSGIISIVVSLIHDAQEIAIIGGTEILNLEMLNQAYEQRMKLLHSYINPSIVKNKSTSKTKKKESAMPSENKVDKTISISALVTESKDKGLDLIDLLRQHFTIIEVVT